MARTDGRKWQRIGQNIGTQDLVLGVRVAVEKENGDSIDILFKAFRDDRPQVVAFQRHEHLAGSIKAFPNLETEMPGTNGSGL